MTADRNQLLYLQWLSGAHPDIYRRAIAGARGKAAVGLGQLGWINFVIQAIGIAAGALAQKKQIDKTVDLQKRQIAADTAQRAADRDAQTKVQLLQVNTERAKAGLPPVDITGKVIPGSALPTPAALAPFVNAATGSSWVPGVPNYVVAGGGALALILLLKVAKVF